MPREIYICADGNDFAQEQRLRQALKPVLPHLGLSLWGTRDILPSANRIDEIKSHVERAHIFVALVSASFLANDNCSREVRAAAYRAQCGELKIVSIMLKSVPFFELTPLAGFPALPKNGGFLTDYSNQDKAWTEVLRDLIESIGATHRYIA